MNEQLKWWQRIDTYGEFDTIEEAARAVAELDARYDFGSSILESACEGGLTPLEVQADADRWQYATRLLHDKLVRPVQENEPS